MGRTKKSLTPFYVINWDVNARKFIKYDVMPYLVDCYRERKKKKRNIPTTFDEFKEFVEGNSLYRYWARCEYEIILMDWPCSQTYKKIDVHWQIMMNLDIVTRILMENVGVC